MFYMNVIAYIFLIYIVFISFVCGAYASKGCFEEIAISNKVALCSNYII